MSELHRFAVVDGSDVEQLVLGLQQRLRLRRDPPQRVTRQMLDTFDWRIHADVSLLEHRRWADGRCELVWSSLRTGEILGRLELDHAPRFARDLPEGQLRERLASVLEMRALTAVVTAESSRTMLRLVDDRDKTIARLVVDRSRWNGQDLPAVVEVLPLRGYSKAAEGLVELLGAQVVLRGGGDDPLHAALTAAGLVAGSYSSKLRISFESEATAVEAWTQVLRTLLATMTANTPGVIDDLDSEFLHDYRVAVRRTRSVLSQAGGILPPDVLDRFRREFSHLGEITGPTRDFDVYLLALPKFATALPSDRRSHLEPFGTFLEKRQRESHRALVSELASAGCTGMLRDWQAWLEAPEVDVHAAPEAMLPATDVAARRIWRAYRRLVRAGREITVESRAEVLHDLRKDAKRLRYLLECFDSLFPADEVAPIVKELKALQDVLGEFQDSEVQADSLETFAQDLLEEGEVSAPTLMSMGYLVEQLDERRRAARDAFASRFARFDAKQVRDAARSLFRVPAPADEAPEVRLDIDIRGVAS